MKKIYKILLIALVVFIAGLFLFTKQDFEDFKTQLARVSVDYDQSVKAEHGKPIRVVKAVDGDTVQLINGEHLRYIGIDTPEEFDPRKPVQCFARTAAAKNKELVEGKLITFYKDKTERDQYGRLLGFVYLPDSMLVKSKE